MKSKGYLPIFVLILFSVILISGCGGQKDKPPIIVISVDTLRADHLGYNNHSISTPVIDSLAGRGKVFSEAYASAPITLPSHTSLFTGTYPTYHKVRNNGAYYLNDSLKTLPEVLKEYGYTTAAFIGAEVLSADYGLDQGFDHYDDGFRGKSMRRFVYPEKSADKIVESAENWMEENKKSSDPFFLWLHFFDPHVPYFNHPGITSSKAQSYYDAEIEYVDYQLNRFFSYLNSRDLMEEALVVFTADHGEGLNDHKEKTHSYFVYNSTMRIPLIFYYENKLKHEINDSVCSIVDVMPTILDICNFSQPRQIQGKNLLDSDSGEQRAVYGETYMPKELFGWSSLKMIIKGDWKYIEAPNPELYNLNRDPGEQKNLVERQTNKRTELESDFARLREKYTGKDNFKYEKSLSREKREKLESLGYIFNSGKKREKSSDIDPKTMIDKYNFFLDARNSLSYSGKSPDERTKEVIKELIEKGGDTFPVYRVLYYYYKEKDQREKAEETLRKCMRDNPENYYANKTMGEYLMNEGEFEEALTYLNRAIELMPKKSELYVLRGKIKGKLNREKEALKAYLKFLDMDDNHPLRADIAYNAANIYEEYLNDKNKALKYYRIALKEGSNKEFVQDVRKRINNLE